MTQPARQRNTAISGWEPNAGPSRVLVRHEARGRFRRVAPRQVRRTEVCECVESSEVSQRSRFFFSCRRGTMRRDKAGIVGKPREPASRGQRRASSRCHRKSPNGRQRLARPLHHSGLRPGAYHDVLFARLHTIVAKECSLSGTAVVSTTPTWRRALQERSGHGEKPTVDSRVTTRQVTLDQAISRTSTRSRTPFALGVLIPASRRVRRRTWAARWSQKCRALGNNGRTFDQRMMVNGVAPATASAGWGGGAGPKRPERRVRHDVSA